MLISLCSHGPARRPRALFRGALLAFLAAGLVACGTDNPPPANDGGPSDGGAVTDGGPATDGGIVTDGGAITPTRLAFVVQPSSAVSGAAIAPPITVAVLDASGRVVTGSTLLVTVALAGGTTGASLSGTKIVNAAAGVATFGDLKVDKAGSGYTLVATAQSVDSATSSAFDVAAGAAVSLSFLPPPTLGEAGAPLDGVAVEAVDAAGNRAVGFTGSVTVAFSINTTGATLSGTLTRAAAAGVARFTDLSIDRAGQGYTLAASATGLAAATSQPFDVTWTTAASLRVASLPAELVAGAAASFTVTALDRFENVVRDYDGTVVITSSDPQAVLPASHAFTLGDAGTFTFTGFAFRSAGVQRAMATDSADPTITGVASSAVSPSTAASLRYLVGPGNASVRAPLAEVRVAVQDAFGNLVPTATDTIAVALSPASGALSGSTSALAEGGVARFAGLSVANEGNGYTLVASAMGRSSIVSTPFNVIDNVAPSVPGTFEAVPIGEQTISLSWTAPGDDGDLGTLVQAGAFYFLRVTDRGPSGTVRTFRSGDGSGMPAPSAPGSAEAFDVDGLSSGASYRFQLYAVDGAGNSSAPAEVIESTLLCSAGYTGPACADCATGYHKDPGAPAVCVDACTAPNPCSAPPINTCSGNTATRYPNPGQCSLGAGVGEFHCDYAPAPTDCAASSQICYQGGCIAPPPTLELSGFPASVVAGQAIQATATVRAGAQIATGYVGTMRITSTDPATTIDGVNVPVEVAFTAALGGVRPITVVFRSASTTGRTLTMTDVSMPLTTAQASSVVTPASPARLAFLQQPSNANVRVSIAPPITVAVTDAFGNTVTSSSESISVAAGVNPRSAVLSGTASSAASAGVATFSDLSFDNEGTGMTLVATPTSSGIAAATSAPFTVTDNVAPGPVADFQTSALGTSQSAIPLHWTAPGDDGNLGDLTYGSYTLVYSKTALTPATFGGATVFPTLAPLLVGLPENEIVTGLDAGTLYYFGLRVDDGAGNSSYAFAQGSTLPCDQGYVGNHCQSCADGYVAEGPLCIAVCLTNPCHSAPADFCTANVATNHVANGICSTSPSAPFYTCDYLPMPTDCAGLGERCFGAGVCAPDPCQPNPCTAVPATKCEADGIQRTTYGSVCTATAPGTFTCAYPATTVSCGPDVCYNATCVAASAPLAGELIVSEVLATASAPLGDWFEVRNRTGKNLNIAGLTVTFGASPATSFTVPSAPPVIVPSQGFFVFGQSTDTTQNGNVAVNYAYGPSPDYFLLASGGTLALSLGGTALDAPLNWDATFPGLAGTDTSMQLSAKVFASGAFHDKPWFWCAGTPSSPGGANGDCGITVTPPIDYCAVQFPTSLGTLTTGDASTVYGRFYEPNVSTRNQQGNDLYPFVEMDLGYGATNDPSTWTAWTRTTPNAGYGPGSPGFASNNDEHQATVTFGAAGTYFYAFRVRLIDPVSGGPGPYVYCDANNVVTANPPTSAAYGTVTVVGPMSVVSASASTRTRVSVVFDKNVDTSSVLANGSQFTFSGGVTASAAAVNGTNPKQVDVTTSAQPAATAITVTVAGSLTSGGGGVRAPANTATFTALPSCGTAPKLVISQIYSGGNNTTGTASYKVDYVELHNRGATAASLSGYSLQYNGGTSVTAWGSKINLNAVTLQPGQYYLVAFSTASGAVGATLPVTADQTSSGFSLATAGGKVALVSNTTLLPAPPNSCNSDTPVALPVATSIIDFVGYGSTTNCAEGKSVAGTPTTMQAILRAGGRCTDTNANGADFSLVDPTASGSLPFTSGSTAQICCDD